MLPALRLSGRRRAAGGAGGGKPSPPQSAVVLRSKLSKATEVQVLSAPNAASVMLAKYPVALVIWLAFRHPAPGSCAV
ncbi:hypothetical protein GCM10017687_68490 [Streptomyces echinatus]